MSWNTPKSELFEQAITPNELIETLQSHRFKTGQGQRTGCFGASTLREKVRDLELKSIEPTRVNNFNELVIKAYEHDAQRKTSHRETVFIPLSLQSTSLIGDDGLVVNTRHRQAVNRHKSSSGTHLREISITANSSDDGVEIKQLIYVNGYLAEWVTWRLNS